MTNIADQLKQVRFSDLQLRLELEEDFAFDFPVLLQLRRELRQAAGLLSRSGDTAQKIRLQQMLMPADFADPVARRRFRRPSPAFVFAWPPAGVRRLRAGDELVLPFRLWGHGRSQLSDLLRLFAALGQIGLHHNHGRFRLLGAESAGEGARRQLWQSGEPLMDLETPYSDLEWWLGQIPETDELELEFLTPARVLSRNRPLFKPQPAELFAAMLRRVTGMIYAWAGVELPLDARQLIETAASLQPLVWSLAWRDWRQLAGEEGSQDLGGLLGVLTLAGPGLKEVGWVYQLCELFNLGRGAAYGGGCCRISQNLLQASPEPV